MTETEVYEAVRDHEYKKWETENAKRAEPNKLGLWERKLDKCNHVMEFMRTCLGLLTVTLQIVILLKLFNII